MKTQTLTKTARRILLATAVSTTVLTASAAANWTGGGADTKWSTPKNWSSEAVPTSGDIRFWEPEDFVSPFKDLDEKVVLFDDAYNPGSTIYVRKVGAADNPLVFEATSSANGLNAGGEWKIGYNDNEPGYLRLKSGTWSTASGKVMTLGTNNSKTWGELAVTDGATLTLGGNLNVLRGKVTLENASLTVDTSKNVNFGQYSGHDSVFELKAGGVFTTPFVRQYDGSSGGGTFLFNGGVLKANKADSSGFIQNSAYLTVKVGAGGGTIDADGKNISIKRPIEPDGEDGGMKFIGGSTITFDAAPTYTGGTTIELGTKVVASDATAKDTILGNLVIDGRAVLEGKTYDVLECSGLTAADLANVTLVNCAAGSTVGFDDDETPTKIVVTLAEPTCLTTSSSLVFPGKTLDDIKEADFTCRFCGAAALNCIQLDSGKGYNKKLYFTNGSLTGMVVEMQVADGNHVKCVAVEFTKGESGVYAKVLGAGYAYWQSLGYVFLEPDKTTWHRTDRADVATTRTGSGYGICDLRVTAAAATVEWTLDADKNWSDFSGYDALGADDFVRITATGNYALTMDTDVNVGKIEFMDASGSTMIVSSGKTVTTEGVSGIGNILNNGTIFKKGDGTAYMPFNNASTGVTVVNSGTLKIASHTGAGSSHTVRVKSGATFDMNGWGDTVVSVILEEDAHFVNSRGDIGADNMQTKSITLEGDATATASKNFGLVGGGHAETTLALGSNTLTLNGNAAFWLVNTTITGAGTIAVDKGTLQVPRRSSSGADCTLNIGANGTLRIDNDLSLTVKNFCNGGTVRAPFKEGNNLYAQGMLVVTGTLTSGNAIPILTLANGATVKATGTAQVVSTTFSASGAYTIDASDISVATLREGNVAVLTVPASFDTTSATWAVSGATIAGTRAKWRTDAGGETKTLYIARPSGLMVIVR